MRCLVFAIMALPALPASLSAVEKPAAATLPKIRVAADGRSFETAAGARWIPFGVNYYRPGTGWAPQLWKQFDAEATRRDFARLKELGATCVRVFLTYGSFFNRPDALDPEGLAKFDQFLQIAEAAGIYVHPTGPDHWEGRPDWAKNNRYAEERALQEIETFWRLFAARYRGRNVLFAYDLLNEPTIPWTAPAAPDKLLEHQRRREDIADTWVRRQSQAIKQADRGALVTVGYIQWSVPAVLPGVQHYAAFRPQRQAALLDFLEIHFYPLAKGFYEYSAEDEQRNLAYLESVVREVAACGKPVVIAEFGWCGGGSVTLGKHAHRAASEEDQARWCRRAVETTRGLATGWLNWGFYDHPQARDVSQLTGLLTVDGTPKAWAREFQTLATGLLREPWPTSQLGPRPKLDWDRAIVDPRVTREFQEAYYQAYLAEQKHSHP